MPNKLLTLPDDVFRKEIFSFFLSFFFLFIYLFYFIFFFWISPTLLDSISFLPLVERQHASGQAGSVVDPENFGRLTRPGGEMLIATAVISPKVFLHLLVTFASHIAVNRIGCNKCTFWTRICTCVTYTTRLNWNIYY